MGERVRPTLCCEVGGRARSTLICEVGGRERSTLDCEVGERERSTLDCEVGERGRSALVPSDCSSEFVRDRESVKGFGSSTKVDDSPDDVYGLKRAADLVTRLPTCLTVVVRKGRDHVVSNTL